jgi:ribose 5-phosphate isomerase A
LKSVSRHLGDGKKTEPGYQDVSGRLFSTPFPLHLALSELTCYTADTVKSKHTLSAAVRFYRGYDQPGIALHSHVFDGEKGEHVPFSRPLKATAREHAYLYTMVQQSQQDRWKQLAGEAAAALIEDGMVVGLGTGSTAAYLVTALGARLQAGLRIVGAISSSIATKNLAASLNIPLTTLDDHPDIDIYIDGADEIDPHLNLIKGAGGALLREKILASCARRFIVVADPTKRVDRLGRRPLPVEVIPLAITPVRNRLQSLGAQVQLRQSEGKVFITDNSNVILDCVFPQGITDAIALNTALHEIVGVVEDGLFIHMAQQAIIGGPEGVLTLSA